MERILLIARREYLAYVRAWGFWISLALLPVIGLGMGVFVPALLSRAEPPKLVSVVAADPADLVAVDQRIAERRRGEVRDALEAHATGLGGEPASVAALAAFDAAEGLSGLDAAAEAIRANCREAMAPRCARPLAGFTPPPETLIRVEAPATTPDAIRPFLTGEQTVAMPGGGEAGARPLNAAVFIERAEEGGRTVDIWSTAVVGTEIRRLVERAVAERQRLEAYAQAGLAGDDVRRIDALAPTVRTLDPRRTAGTDATVTTRDRLPYAAAFILAFVLWSAVFGVANMLLTSVIEEKSNKILDTLLTSVRYHELLAGKLLGVAGVSATMLSAWGLMLLSATQYLGATNAGGQVAAFLAAVSNPGLLLPFLALFAVGYLMFGAIFLAMGSLCETLQEAQTLMTPVIVILIGPLLFMPIAIENPQSQVLEGASWFPLFTPFLLLARLPSAPPLVEILGPAVLMVVTMLLILWGAAAVFRGGASGRLRADALLKRAKPVPQT